VIKHDIAKPLKTRSDTRFLSNIISHSRAPKRALTQESTDTRTDTTGCTLKAHLAFFVMGLYFRKRLGLGPLALNFSKSGIGISAGVRGLRAGVSSHRRVYSSVGLRGTACAL
jgi:hypothetical protein